MLVQHASPTCARRRVSIGFPGDLWARQNTTLRSMDRQCTSEFELRSTEHPDVQVADRRRDLDGLLRRRTAGQVHPSRQHLAHRLAHRPAARPMPLIVCSYIQVVYAGVNLTSPDACAQTAFTNATSKHADLARQAEQPLTGQVSRICSVPPAMVRQRVLRKSSTCLVVDDACALGELHPEFGQRLAVPHADQLARAGLRTRILAAHSQFRDLAGRAASRPERRRSSRRADPGRPRRGRGRRPCAATLPSGCPARCRGPSRPARWPAWCAPAASRR